MSELVARVVQLAQQQTAGALAFARSVYPDHHQGGHAQSFRKLRYTVATGELRVHDSDLYASGKEGPARVIQRTITLSGDDRARVESAIAAVWARSEPQVHWSSSRSSEECSSAIQSLQLHRYVGDFAL